ncbi:MAG: PTS sugar transporter subunit IIA [Gammaproteobacteria bacterium]
MSVGVLLVTHNEVGAHLVKSATGTLGRLPLPTEVVSVDLADSVEQVAIRVRNALDALEQPDGVLVLTDLFGATPSNVANRAIEGRDARCVAGVNLPMLLRVMNYSGKNLDELVETAYDGGRNGIIVT